MVGSLISVGSASLAHEDALIAELIKQDDAEKKARPKADKAKKKSASNVTPGQLKVNWEASRKIFSSGLSRGEQLLQFKAKRERIQSMKAQLYLGSKSEIKQLCFVTLDTLRDLPKDIGVYIVMDEDDEILYVGATWKQGLFLRWANGHHRKPDIEQHPLPCKIYYQAFDFDATEEHVRCIENLMQEIHQPLWNDMPVNRSASTSNPVSTPSSVSQSAVVAMARETVGSFFGYDYCQSCSAEHLVLTAIALGRRYSKQSTPVSEVAN